MSSEESQIKTKPKVEEPKSKKSVVPDTIVKDLDSFTKYCENEKNTGLCEAYVKVFNDNKRLSSNVTQVQIENASKSTRSVIWVLFIIFLIVILVTFIPQLFSAITDGISGGLEGLFEETTP